MKLQKTLIDRTLRLEKCLLIVLDACNYGYFVRWFKENNPEKVRHIQAVQSSGTRTILWVENTFKNTKYDAVYVSGNPFINSIGVTPAGKIAVKCFKRIVDAWRDWDNKEETCLAETVNKHAILNFDSPRLVVHYMQPHQPYIGDYRIPDEMYTSSPWHLMKKAHDPPSIRQIDGITMKKLTKEYKKIIRKAYYSNMNYVCMAMMKLIEKREGVIAITADHSELMGEYGMWFHWGYHKETKKVPWVNF